MFPKKKKKNESYWIEIYHGLQDVKCIQKWRDFFFKLNTFIMFVDVSQSPDKNQGRKITNSSSTFSKITLCLHCSLLAASCTLAVFDIFTLSVCPCVAIIIILVMIKERKRKLKDVSLYYHLIPSPFSRIYQNVFYFSSLKYRGI